MDIDGRENIILEMNETNTSATCPRCKSAANLSDPKDYEYSLSSAFHWPMIRYHRLCHDCLSQIDRSAQNITDNNLETPIKPTDLSEDLHFYIESGLYVFTTEYHILRGSCCGSRCRYCPYGDWSAE
jgi:hypothetical protein